MKSILAILLLLAGAVVRADELGVRMLPGEKWWGLGSAFGRQMPFDESSDFRCDLRADNYGNQTQSVLVSDKGRVLYCDAPVAAALEGGTIRLSSDRGEIRLEEKAGRTLAEAFRFASRTCFPPTGEEPELLYFSAPQYNTWIELTYRQNEKDVLAYARSMLEHGLPPGVFMIDDTWQLDYGTWVFDPRRFADPKGMVAKLHAMGFKVVLWVCPYVSMDSPAFRLLEFGVSPDTVVPQPKGGFVREAGSDRAAAVEWWNGRSALVDLSHPNGRAWFKGRLDGLRRDFGIDGFKFDNGGVANYVGMAAHDATLDAAGQNGLYASLALDCPGSECRSAFGLAGKPVVMRLHDKGHTWEALRRLVPDMLAAGLTGYPFVCPDMIGGGSWEAFLPGSPFDPELFVRSAQIHALCPMMQISASPWRVLGADHQQAFLAAVKLRQKFAPAFVALAKKAAKDGEPIMRPLEYNYPGCGYADVKDAFMMGEDLLVAPMVEKGKTSRKVRLPPGRWRSDLGDVVAGPCEISVDAPLGRVPHFMRVPDVVKVGFMTDTHVRPDEKSCARVKKAFELFRREGVVAVGHCGDLADFHYPEGYRHYRAAFEAAYPDPADAPKTLYVFAGHDALVPGTRPPQKMPDERAFAEMRDILKIDHGIIHETVIGGVPFVVYPQSIHHHCGGSLAAFDRHLAKVCAEHPTGPVVLMTHFPPKDTVADSQRWGNAMIGAVIRKYPRVIAFTGHLHNSLRNEACIWQGDCTVVDVGCLEVWQGESAGTKAVSKPAYEVIVAEFAADRVVLRRYDVRDGSEIRPDAPWTVPLPYDAATAPYAPARRAAAERAGRFPSDARISVAAEGETVAVKFPPVANEDDVLWYRIAVNGRTADVFSAFYVRPQDRAAFRERRYAKDVFGSPDADGSYRVEVTPVGFFGAKGAPLKTVWKE